MKFRNRVLRSSLLPAAFFTLVSAVPASAQYWGPPAPIQAPAGRIPPQHIEAMVRSLGYQPVAEPRPRGPLWVTHAVDRDGQQVRVLIDGFNGRVIDVLRRPLPPQRVAIAPPPNLAPPVHGPLSDSDYDGPDYDYRDVPRQRPADWPPSRPQVQQQGPNVIPHSPRSENERLPAPPKNAAKKKETKKNSEKTAAIKPDKENEKTPSPNPRPIDAPKADTKPETKPDKPKSAETPTFVPNADQRPTGSVPAPAPDVKKNETPQAAPNPAPSTLPPVQPLL